MTARTIGLTAVLLSWLLPMATAEDPRPEMSPKQFRRLSVALLEDPLPESAPDLARLVILYTMETPDAGVVLGEKEMTWIAKDDKRSIVLLAAYVAGNVQSQLHSGVQRNDRYSGLMYLFQVYRQLQAKDKEFRIKEIDELLKLHKDDKLVAHLSEVEKKKPTKLTREQEAKIQELLKPKKK